MVVACNIAISRDINLMSHHICRGQKVQVRVQGSTSEDVTCAS